MISFVGTSMCEGFPKIFQAGSERVICKGLEPVKTGNALRKGQVYEVTYEAVDVEDHQGKETILKKATVAEIK
jgi:hypothetical protein